MERTRNDPSVRLITRPDPFRVYEYVSDKLQQRSVTVTVLCAEFLQII